MPAGTVPRRCLLNGLDGNPIMPDASMGLGVLLSMVTWDAIQKLRRKTTHTRLWT